MLSANKEIMEIPVSDKKDKSIYNKPVFFNASLLQFT
jgi:hypothetical protein